MTFKVDVKKTAIVYPGTVRYVCSELKKKGRGRNEVYQVPMDVHEDKLSSPRCREVLPQFSDLLEKVNPAFAARDCTSLVAFAE